MSRVQSHDFNVLANIDLFADRLAVKKHVEGHMELFPIAKTEVTAWQLFLRAFGRGNLAKIDPYLSSVTSYLNWFDWSQVDTSDPAYQTVCHIANKALRSKWETTLFNKVAQTSVEKKMEFTHFRDYCREYSHTVIQTINLNPFVQVRDVEALVRKKYPSWTNSIRLRDENGHLMGADERVTPEILEKMRISIDHYEASRVVVIESPVKAEPEKTKTSTGYGSTKRR